MTTEAPLQAATKRSTRDALLDATERLIIESGVVSVTTRRVASLAGVNPALINYYFQSLDALMIAVVTRVVDRVAEKARTAFATDEPFVEKWRRWITDGVEDAMRQGWTKLWLEVITLASNRPDMLELYRKQTAPMRDLFEGAMESELRRVGGTIDACSLASLVAFMNSAALGIVVQTLIESPEDRANKSSALHAILETDLLEVFIGMLHGQTDLAAATTRDTHPRNRGKKVRRDHGPT
jgi:AcrR family transcriptional regulator